MDLRGKNLMLIGGAGFIGSHTLDQLLKEDVGSITVYDNFARGTITNIENALKDPRVRIAEHGGDILHPDILHRAMKGMDGVFHFAALWLLHCQEYPASAFEVNIKGTFNVVEACISQKVKRLVFSSSASVYGDAVVEPMTEEHPFNNTNFYGATKIAGEQICRSLYHRHKALGDKFGYAGLRYMNVYGPRQDYQGAYIAVIMRILDDLDRGVPPTIHGDGSQAYDFVYVGDCARANVLAMKSEQSDQCYNVGTGVKTTIRELADLLLQIKGSDLKLNFQEGGRTYVKNRVGSTDKAYAHLGFRWEVSLEQGLKDLIAWRDEQIQRSSTNNSLK